MTDTNLKLAELIGSRICHDLINPVGAITNGLELLDLTGNMDGPELDLIRDSVANASLRIRFLRVAFGSASQQLLGQAEVLGILRDYSSTGRIAVDWTLTDAQPRSDVRLALLAVLCCETAMPFGGSLRIARDGEIWAVTGTAEKINLDPGIWATLDSDQIPVELPPALVQFALLPRYVRAAARQLSVMRDDTSVTLTF